MLAVLLVALAFARVFSNTAEEDDGVLARPEEACKEGTCKEAERANELQEGEEKEEEEEEDRELELREELLDLMELIDDAMPAAEAKKATGQGPMARSVSPYSQSRRRRRRRRRRAPSA